MYRTLFFLILLVFTFADEPENDGVDLVSEARKVLEDLSKELGQDIDLLNDENKEFLTKLLTEMKKVDLEATEEKLEEKSGEFEQKLKNAISQVHKEVTEERNEWTNWDGPETIEKETEVAEVQPVTETLANVVDAETAAPSDPSVVFVLFLFLMGLSILGFAVYYLSQQKANQVVWHEDDEIEKLMTSESYYQGGDCIAA